MDTLSQAVLGGAVAVVATRGHLPVRAMIYGAIIGTLPDLDVLLPFENDLQAMIQHRTWTHSWFVLLLIGPLLALLLHRIDSRWSLRDWMSLVLLVLLTHPALDAFTIYGTWLWWPFMEQPLMGGSIFIIDPLYTLPLLVGLVVAWRTSSRRTAVFSATLGLTISTVYLLWGLLAQQYVERIAWQSITTQGLSAERLIATPTPFNSILWRVLAVDGANYHEGYYHLILDEEPPPFQSYPRQPQLAAEIDPNTGFPAFANFNHGYFKLARQSDQVIASDLRMGVEPFFFFQFVMKDSPTGGEVPRQAPVKIEPGRLFGWLTRRLGGAELPPLPRYPGGAATPME